MNFILYFAVFFSSLQGNVGHLVSHKAILDKIMDVNDPRVPPPTMDRAPVIVDFNIVVRSIRGLMAKEETLYMDVNVNIRWDNPSFQWNESEYEGIHQVHVPVEDIWHPDLVLSNSIDGERTATEVLPLNVARIQSSGKVLWDTTAQLVTDCDFDVYYYPMDVQVCPLKWGSWAYNGMELDLFNLSASANMDIMDVRGEFEVIDIPVRRHSFIYPCCPEPYVDLTYYVIMRRRPHYYVFNMLIPCVLLLVLGALVFVLPAESGEKTGMALTIMLGVTVFSLVVMEHIPSSAQESSLFEKFFSTTFGLLFVTTCMSVVSVKLSIAGNITSSRIPPCLRVFLFKGVARIFCMRETVRFAAILEKMEKEISEKNDTFDASREYISLNHVAHIRHDSASSDGLQNHSPKGSVKEEIDANANNEEEKLDILINHVHELSTRLKQYHQQQQSDHADDDMQSAISREWVMAATVMDRLYLVIFITGVLLAAILLYLNIPDNHIDIEKLLPE